METETIVKDNAQISSNINNLTGKWFRSLFHCCFVPMKIRSVSSAFSMTFTIFPPCQ